LTVFGLGNLVYISHLPLAQTFVPTPKVWPTMSAQAYGAASNQQPASSIGSINHDSPLTTRHSQSFL